MSNENENEINLQPMQRGFLKGKFIDSYGAPCSIQESSNAGMRAIWLGVDDAMPQVLARDAGLLGVQTSERNGWVPFPIPSEVLMSTRMHLTQEQVAALLPALTHFVETGELPE